MLKSLQDLNIGIIKCQNKDGNDATKEAVYGANEIIFQNLKTPISSRRKARIQKALTEIGVTLNNAEVHGKAEPKKKEILDYLRKYLRILKEYQPQDNVDDCLRVVKYQVSQFVRAKDKLTTVEDICCMLVKNKEIAEDYGMYHTLNKAQEELVGMLEERFCSIHGYELLEAYQ